METTNPTKTQMIKPVRMILTTFVALIAVLIAVIPAASAELIEVDDLLEIGPIVDIGPPDLAPVPQLSATAAVECGAEDVLRVNVSNNTNLFVGITIWVDADQVEFKFMAAHDSFEANYAATENSTTHVVVEVGGNELVNKDLDVDCLAADPWFEFIANCDVGQAWVELGNHGPDSAIMGVHYDDLPYAGGNLAAGESSVQALAVQPNEFVGFAIEADGEAIYTEGFFFDCPIVEADEGEGEVEVEVEADAPEEVEATASATPEPPPQSEEVVETAVSTGGDDEIAMAAGLEVQTEPTSTGIMVGLLLTFGIAAVVGAVAALKLRRR